MSLDPQHTPTLSLVTVCRNSSATIKKTIESVLAQKDAGVEYLVVDGLSTDGTQEIVRSYRGIDRFISEPDGGIADAFNKGIRMASGEIIGLINSDDQLCPAALATVRRYFADSPETDVLHGDVLLVEGERVIKRLQPPRRWWYPWRLVLFNHPATFVRRRVYEERGLFDTRYRIAMDVEIFLRWLANGVKVRYLPQVLVHMQAGGVSGQQAILGYREARDAALQHGFSPFLAQLQFMGKLGIWWLLQRLNRADRLQKKNASDRKA